MSRLIKAAGVALLLTAGPALADGHHHGGGGWHGGGGGWVGPFVGGAIVGGVLGGALAPYAPYYSAPAPYYAPTPYQPYYRWLCNQYGQCSWVWQ